MLLGHRYSDQLRQSSRAGGTELVGGYFNTRLHSNAVASKSLDGPGFLPGTAARHPSSTFVPPDTQWTRSSCDLFQQSASLLRMGRASSSAAGLADMSFFQGPHPALKWVPWQPGLRKRSTHPGGCSPPLERDDDALGLGGVVCPEGSRCHVQIQLVRANRLCVK